MRSHLEYACTLWDPYAYKNIFMQALVQKFACKVCLKQWELDCDSMLHLLGITRLSTRQQSLKLAESSITGHHIKSEAVKLLAKWSYEKANVFYIQREELIFCALQFLAVF